jgi:hypothetical protein
LRKIGQGILPSVLYGAKKMNMISTGGFTEMDASNKQDTLVNKLVTAWEKKNSRTAKAGGASLMALSLAACGSSDDGESTITQAMLDSAVALSEATEQEKAVEAARLKKIETDAALAEANAATAAALEAATPAAVVTPATPTTFDLTPLTDIASSTQALNGSLSSTFRFTSGDEVINGMTATMAAADTLLDPSGTDNDTLNVTLTGNTTITTSNVETINLTYAVAAADFASANTGTTAYNISGSVAGVLSAPASTATINLVDYTRIATVEGLTLTGTTAAGSAETLSISVSGATYGATAGTQTGVTIDGTDGQSLETLNIESAGSAANTFALAFENTETVGTYNITGTQDINVRAPVAKVSGTTVTATSNTGNVGINLESAGITVNAANWTGVDDIVLYDTDATAGAATLNSVASGQDVIVKNTVSTLTVAPTGATFSGFTAAADLEMDSTSATAGVTVTTYAVQNVTALNLISNGLASSTSTTAANTITNLDADFSTITITGDTSLLVTDLDIEAVQTATSATTARAVTVDASAMTGNAFVNLTASADAKVSYTMTGTDGADTLIANASGSSLTGGGGKDVLTGGGGVDTINGGLLADHIDMSYGADSLTGGTGNDTYDLDVTAGAAVVHVVTVDAEGVTTATVVASGTDSMILTLNGVSYSTVSSGTGHDTGLLHTFTAAHKDAILAQHGVTLADVDASGADGFSLTGKADGTTFTADFSHGDGGVIDAITEVVTTGSAATDVASTINDFQSGDIMDLAGISLSADGGYYEGAAGSFTTSTEFQVLVLTGASYTSSTTAADAIDARYTGTDADSQVFVYLDSTDGHAVMAYDSNIHVDGAATLNELVDFDSITNLTDLASIMTADTFTLA